MTEGGKRREGARQVRTRVCRDGFRGGKNGGSEGRAQGKIFYIVREDEMNMC